ncbi:MAG: hypothetical protein ISR83_08150 [Candidatus Marinimicrobia bacterium]|nr:hypothetical protein [Candidatus Neomarinimicrobiota bacterium]
MKIYFYAMMICLGLYGFIAGVKPEWSQEILLGLLAPAVVGLLTVLMFSRFKTMTVQQMAQWLMISFGIKMIIYPLYFIILFKFYSFAPYPFVFSFAGYFIGLHIVEAVVLKSKSK